MTATRTPAPDLALDDYLCLALYTASRAMTARYRVLLARTGLTYPQYLVMTVLWQDGPTTVGRIGSRLRLDSSTLSPLLKRLETMELVARTRDQHDERTVNVSLTAAGHRLRTRATEVPQQVCDATGLPPTQQARLVAHLRTLADHLESSP